VALLSRDFVRQSGLYSHVHSLDLDPSDSHSDPTFAKTVLNWLLIPFLRDLYRSGHYFHSYIHERNDGINLEVNRRIV
jgi:hypothetical protein